MIVRACKALHGLKQSALEWYNELWGSILAEGWKVSKYDDCVYYHRAQGRIAVMCTYMDGTILTGDDVEEKARVRNNSGENTKAMTWAHRIRSLGAGHDRFGQNNLGPTILCEGDCSRSDGI